MHRLTRSSDARISSEVLTQTKGRQSSFPGVDEALDRRGESADAGEGAAPDGPPTEDREPGRDLVESAGAGGREVELDARVLAEPGLDVGGLVGREVVDDDVKSAPGWARASSWRKARNSSARCFS